MSRGITVLYEDNHLLAVFKEAGKLSQGDKSGDLPITEFAKDYLIKKYQKEGDAFIGLPHRLDRPTSGVLLLAKTSKALSRLNKMFQNHQLQKKYWAVVANRPPADRAFLQDYLSRNRQKNKSFVVDQKSEDAKLAELDYQLILELDRYYLLETKPKTGRHHQIRVQLSAMGCPIKGDLKYGFPRSNNDASIHLHARSIEFEHPVMKQKMIIYAPAPEKDPIWKICNQKFPTPAANFAD